MMLSGRRARDLRVWLEERAEIAHSNKDLARRFVKKLRRTHAILSGIPIIDRLSDALKAGLDAQLTELVDGRDSQFIQRTAGHL